MRSAYTTKGVRSVTAWALVFDGQHAGNIVTYAADSGGVTATVGAWTGRLGDYMKGRSFHGHASGYGYDKQSAAVADCLVYAEVPGAASLHAAGMNTVRRHLEELGYVVCEVIS